MNSLRVRLVSLVLATVTIAWFAMAFLVWQEATNELNELITQLPSSVRAEIEPEHRNIIGEIAEHLAQPILVAFPVLGLLLLVVINWALYPLQQLAVQVAARKPKHLELLSVEKTPNEIQPLIVCLNHLFTSIAQVIENERRFTADAAHELRTPLAALKAQVQVALAATQPTEKEHALKQMIVGCDRATHLVEQLLLLARLDALGQRELQTVALHELIPDILADLAGLAIAQGSTLEWLESEEITVQGDPALIAVAVRNLVSNALLHNPPEIKVTVALSKSQEGILLQVIDDGIGISGADPMHLVQRFRRGEHTLSAGSGLGLSIVQRIAELHGATFDLVNARQGSGTVASLLWR